MKAVVLGSLVASWAYSAPLQYVSHAGDQYSAPGHSIPAYKVAIEQKADILKLDLHLTTDGVVVLMHDATTERTMSADLTIAAHTYQELYEQCTFKKKGPFDSEKIVRLEQALDLVKDTPMHLWLDPKGYSPKLVETALALVAERGIGKERLMVATFSVSALKYMKEHHPEIRRVLHVSIPLREDGLWVSFEKKDVRSKPEEVLPKLLKKAEELGLHGFNIPLASPAFCKEWVQDLKAKGYWISLWFVQKAEQARRAVEVGADAVVTDDLKVVQPAARDAEK
ncbi:MAG: glycerophosphodiester phosphodiesterase family protein [Lentisphaeria bacterium]|nr:glycerophosphodiester phosphodiesterase family protein [Lentisphaeria bacterium]